MNTLRTALFAVAVLVASFTATSLAIGPRLETNIGSAPQPHSAAPPLPAPDTAADTTPWVKAPNGREFFFIARIAATVIVLPGVMILAALLWLTRPPRP